jgi:hypothetical protein
VYGLNAPDTLRLTLYPQLLQLGVVMVADAAAVEAALNPRCQLAVVAIASGIANLSHALAPWLRPPVRMALF